MLSGHASVRAGAILGSAEMLLLCDAVPLCALWQTGEYAGKGVDRVDSGLHLQQDNAL